VTSRHLRTLVDISAAFVGVAAGIVLKKTLIKMRKMQLLFCMDANANPIKRERLFANQPLSRSIRCGPK